MDTSYFTALGLSLIAHSIPAYFMGLGAVLGICFLIATISMWAFVKITEISKPTGNCNADE